ncbi:MAG: imidazole glycerol phosphate synthase subunit HisF, partial [Chloroflexi bacterium]|nr:imidazole glycerol phosphate synthase subunit HisF [Chloroflexota bacterium]
VEDMRGILEAGADKVAVNTAAVEDPALVRRGADRFGSQCIVLAIDAKRLAQRRDTGGDLGLDGGSRWEVYVHGGRTPTGIDALKWAAFGVSQGAGELLVTSMDADGHQTGYDLELTRAMSESVAVPVIASGGAGGPHDLYAAIKEGKADAVLAASIFHYGTYSIRQVKEYLAGKGIPVRL